MDSLIYGVLFAYLRYYHGALWARHRLGPLLAGLALLAFHKVTMFYQGEYLQQFGLYYSVFSSVLISVGTALLLPWLSALRHGRGLAFRFFSLISLISYSMYLVHFSLVQRILVPWMSSGLGGMAEPYLSIFKYLLFWVLTIGLSILLCKYFELPVMRLRDRFGRAARET
jgi:peptidoglycan/LPS O-acetylase OafA/YrhL